MLDSYLCDFNISNIFIVVKYVIISKKGIYDIWKEKIKE